MGLAREERPARRSPGSLTEGPDRKELLASLHLSLSSWLAVLAGPVLLSFPWHSNSPKLRNPSWQEEGYRRQLMVLAVQQDSEARLKPS